MDFKKYMHIERLGASEVEGIENGECYIFPKIDGTNSSIWMDGKLRAGSRKREITLENDNHGFFNWALFRSNINWENFFNQWPNLRLYGEWLVPHTLETYEENAWRNFYVFDIYNDKEDEYVHYENYKQILDEFGINYIPPICKIKNPTYERLTEMLDKNTFLIKDGHGSGEGIVVKRYGFKNKYGRTVWAKIVKNEFKSKHWSNETTEVKEKKMVEQEIVDSYVTMALVDKEIAKIKNDEGWSSKHIPRLLGTVFHCLVTEETWNFVKKFKNPTVNFKTLQYMTVNKVKELKPEIFN